MMAVAKKAVPKELLDSLLADYRKPEDLIGENGLLKQLTKLLGEKALEAEMAEHLGHGKNEPVENPAGNTRNGKSRKTLKGEFGELPIEIPRDRHGTFEPQLIPKHQTRWTGFDDKILSLYARGMTVREIQSHLEEMYCTEVSPTLISSVTDAVVDEAKAWQSRPLDSIYTPVPPPTKRTRCSASSKTNGTMPTCPSAIPGVGTGRESRRSSTTRRRYVKSSTRPMRLSR
jgi:putative transposase